jgi:hypothetical protein
MNARPPQIDFSGMLPDRPITVRPPTTVGPLSAFGMFVLLFAVGCIVWSLLGVDLARDWRLGPDPVAAADARIEEVRCRSWLYVFTLCSISVADGAAAEENKPTLRYAFIGRQGEKPVTLVRGRSGEAQLATNIGLEGLYNRTLVLMLIGLVLVAAIGTVASVVYKANRQRAAFAGLSRQPLTLVAVEIVHNNLLLPRQRAWVYLDEHGGRRERTIVEMNRKERPIFLSRDERWALAVRSSAGAPSLLLDGNLKCLDLSQDEKVAFLEACRAKLRERGLI